ncbi:hypothetical protein [Gordonia malaquae]|uniref:hypothetical protein n=1 Tax=Gordonia malaquae TaxID=410332 RepID=UPI00301ACD6C
MGRLPANTWARNNEEAGGGRPGRSMPQWLSELSLPQRSTVRPRPGRSARPAREPRSGPGVGARISGAVSRVGSAVDRVMWRRIGIGVVAVAAVVAVVVGLWALARGGGQEEQAAAEPGGGAVEVGSSPVDDGGPLACPAINSEGRMQGATAGDRSSSKGLIMAYEHAFFQLRDPAAMVSMTRPGPYVASAAALKSGLDSIPRDAVWCVSIAPTGSTGVYDVTIRHLDAAGEVVSWRQEMTVEGTGPFYITAVRGK